MYVAKIILQDIFQTQGSVLVSNNPHLCQDHVETVLIKLGKFDEKERLSAYATNGKQETCTKTNLHLRGTNEGDIDAIHLHWRGFLNNWSADHRKFDGYILYSKVVEKEGAVTDIYADRDACHDTWDAHKVDVTEGVDDGHDGNMTSLQVEKETEVYQMFMPLEADSR